MKKVAGGNCKVACPKHYLVMITGVLWGRVLDRSTPILHRGMDWSTGKKKRKVYSITGKKISKFLGNLSFRQIC